MPDCIFQSKRTRPNHFTITWSKAYYPTLNPILTALIMCWKAWSPKEPKENTCLRWAWKSWWISLQIWINNNRPLNTRKRYNQERFRAYPLKMRTMIISYTRIRNTRPKRFLLRKSLRIMSNLIKYRRASKFRRTHLWISWRKSRIRIRGHRNNWIKHLN